MGKLTGREKRKRRREEERRIIELFESGVLEERAKERGEEASLSTEKGDGKKPKGEVFPREQKLLCSRCKAETEKGVCPVCGYKTYIPMSEEKRKKIRGIVAAVLIVAFVAIFAWINK